MNNMNEQVEQPMKKNPFKYKTFYIAYFITVATFVTTLWLMISNREYYVFYLAVGMFSIPYAIIGGIIWLLTIRKRKSVAWGILFGSLTPFIILCIATGRLTLFFRNGPPA